MQSRKISRRRRSALASVWGRTEGLEPRVLLAHDPVIELPFDEPEGATTVTDSAGKQHTGELRLSTNYDVALQDSDGWYHSWPRDAVTVDVKDPLAVHRALLTKYTDSDMHNMLAYLETLK